ncbi:hypothetical protein [Planctomonas psychrotolerans]|uniref:hypothetical protein n=1 Tax=Planctomonas psychrotolerans TaxID=2528712 RepID=UPI001D0CF694|nr:hypothetical protein [Planctomonas psychrotolerans]
MTEIPVDPEESGDAPDPAVPPYRAQLLATEHWSLLASRSTTQSEVLLRIAMLLTVVSAGLLSLGIVGQATGFSETFAAFAAAVLGFASLVGVLTQVRVFNVGMEDLMYVLAMNRLRAAYVRLDPGIEPYLMTSAHDDAVGMAQTYYFLGARSDASQVSGSSMVFVTAINSALLGLLAAAITATSGGEAWLMTVVGVACGLVYCTVSVLLGARHFQNLWRTYEPRFPAPGAARLAGADGDAA